MKNIYKILLFGVLFGALVIPIATLGLAFVFVEIVFAPLVLVPRFITLLLIDTSTTAGIVSLSVLAVISAVFYGLLFAGLYWLFKKTNIVIVGLVAVLFYAVLLATGMQLVQRMVPTEASIKEQITEANYCETKADCVQVVSQCPFGCYVFVNVAEAERLQQLIDQYPSQCVYDCVSMLGYDCVDNKCKVLVDL